MELVHLCRRQTDDSILRGAIRIEEEGDREEFVEESGSWEDGV